MNRILLLEDDVSLIDGLVYSLKKNEFDVEVARTVCEAKQYLSELDRYDLLILDVTLPDGTGFDVCERVRKENQQIPIIFLTASDEEVSIIRGLDSGGDDYITKPFKLGELCSRIRALLRRAGVSKSEKNTSMECGDITIDLLGSRATLKGKALDLTSAEYRLLCLLVRNANRVVTRDIILNELWDDTGNFVDAVVLIWFYVVMHTEGSFDYLLLGGSLPPIKGCFLNMIPAFIQTERQIWLLAAALEIVLFHSDLIIVQRLY